MKNSKVALTRILEIADDESGWNSKINHFIKNRADKDEWEKVDGDYVVDGMKAIEFIMQLKHKDFKRNRTMRELKKRILELEALESQLEDKLSSNIKKSRTKENEFKEFFDFESWEKMNDKILKLFEKCKSGDSAIHTINQVMLMISYDATYATTRTRLTKIRKLVEASSIKKSIKKVILEFLTMPKPINDRINERVEKSNVDRIKTTDNIKRTKVVDMRRMLSYLEEKILTQHKEGKVKHGDKMRLVTYCAIYIGLTTGRRTEEQLKGSFKAIRGKNNFIMFGGQAKKKTIEAEDYEIPVLFADSRDVIKAVEVLRGIIPTATERLDNKRLADKMGAMYRKDWEPIMKKFNLTIGVVDGDIKADKVRNARSAYAITCEKLLNQTSKQKLAQAGYISQILGHMDWDTSTYRSYYRFIPSIERFDLKRYVRDFYKDNEMDLSLIDL